MRAGVDVAAPQISGPLLRGFTSYARWYIRRNFHALRLARSSRPPGLNGGSFIVCMNHPSWWDPLLAITISQALYPRTNHYGPIEAKSLERYKFFEKLGFFGVEPGTASGAARFLRLGEEILRLPGNALWVTAQGTFVDARVRPVQLRSGIAHLAARVPHASIVPLAIEYVFWDERYPEALARFGEPFSVRSLPQRGPREWSRIFAERLERTQEELAGDAMARNRSAFETVLGGSAGVGGAYDGWRACRAWLAGQPYRRAHGAEEM